MEQSPTTHRQPCGDLSRPYAERIDVPSTDEHLDRGWAWVATIQTQAQARRPAPQRCKLPAFAPNMAVSGRNPGNLFARRKPPNWGLRSPRSEFWFAL